MVSLARPTTTTPTPIIQDPEICGGEPTVKGTRVPVRSIVIQWRLYHDLERIRRAFPRLSIPAIEHALAYYEQHRDEIDRAIERTERAAYDADCSGFQEG
ncbi:MAG: DUF433 domain-containing protein [Chloroflexi bacterium]|nr:DUF433 domain-containing protein [Chloroflexota bacterium]